MLKPKTPLCHTPLVSIDNIQSNPSLLYIRALYMSNIAHMMASLMCPRDDIPNVTQTCDITNVHVHACVCMCDPSSVRCLL